jgi:hypothetical protein
MKWKIKSALTLRRPDAALDLLACALVLDDAKAIRGKE